MYNYRAQLVVQFYKRFQLDARGSTEPAWEKLSSRTSDLLSIKLTPTTTAMTITTITATTAIGTMTPPTMAAVLLSSLLMTTCCSRKKKALHTYYKCNVSIVHNVAFRLIPNENLPSLHPVTCVYSSWEVNTLELMLRLTFPSIPLASKSSTTIVL